MTDPPRQFRDRQAPAQAFRLPASLQFAAAQQSDQIPRRTPFSILARSNEPVQHWYWGQIHHDFAGMQIKDSIAVDYCHEDAEILGVGNQFVVGNDGLTITGDLIHFQAGDRVDEITTKRAAGVPYEASIDFRGDNILAEEIGAGFTATVNGRQVQGPALIFRQWPLRGVAICPHGMDQRTSSQFTAEDGQPVALRIYNAGESMKTDTAPAKPADVTKPAGQLSQVNEPTKPATPPQQQSADPAPEKPASAAAAAPPTGADPVAQFRAELQKFTAKFGAVNGAKWYGAGQSYAEALELHADELGRQLATQETELQQLNQKLRALHHGEDIPATQGQDPAEKTPDGNGTPAHQYSHMGKLGNYAASLKIPGQKAE